MHRKSDVDSDGEKIIMISDAGIVLVCLHTQTMFARHSRGSNSG